MNRFLRRVSMAAVALLIGLLAVSGVAPVSQDARAQGEDKIITKELEPFTSIQINGGGTATLEFGPTPSVTIEGNSLVVDRLDAEVDDDGTLVLGSLLTSALDVTGLSELTYTIVTPSIEEIHLAGTIDLHVAPMLNQQSLELGLTTGSEVFIPAITAESITGKLDLLSTAHLAESATTLELQVFNGSTLDAEQLQVQTADLEVKGVSTVTVRVFEALTGTASEGSKVRYMTDDVIPALTTSSLASIQQVASTPWEASVTLEPLATPTS